MKILFIIFFLATLIFEEYRIDNVQHKLRMAEYILYLNPKDSVHVICPRCGWEFPTYIYEVDTLTNKMK